jgi:deoxyribodipyrimidine photo-lyase
MKSLKTFDLRAYKTLINRDTVLFWYRRDLRLEDNAGLYYALKGNSSVLPLFIFDTVILDRLDDIGDKRVQFIYNSLLVLKEQLEECGSTLLAFYGDPVEIFRQLEPRAVYTNGDYEPYARKRDKEVQQMLLAKNIAFHAYKDHVIFEKSEIVKDNGDPYTVFTPYSKKWKATLSRIFVKSYPAKKYIHNLKKTETLLIPTLTEIGFQTTASEFPRRIIKTSIIADYHNGRNFPGINGTSRLSVHLRFGTVSIRKLVRLAQKKNETWLNELIWRDFYQMILWHFPHVEKSCFKPAYNHIQWENDVSAFEAWCEGRTGYPIVDAGMRELNTTGFMHNRVRMIVASFLTKHLLIDWRWGEAYFAKKLLDFDLAANNGGWQWAAGCGCDAAPYFRIFNPELQTKKFDPEHTYIKKWIPEMNTLQYPKPIVDHQKARDRVLKVYRKALDK